VRDAALLVVLVCLCCAFAGEGSGIPPLSAQVTSAPAAFGVEVTGEGKPMILIPGLISSGEVWKGAVAHYAGSYECHALTLAGFAGQPPSGITPFLPAVRDELAAYIRRHQLERPVIVGHSLGGFLALSLASRYPDLVGKLVIVEGLPAPGAEQNPDATAEEMKALADRVAGAFATSDDATRRAVFAKTMATRPEHVEAIASWARASDPATVTTVISEIITTDLRTDLGRIETPVLVLASLAGSGAASDAEGLERMFRSQYRHLKTWRLELTSRARHFIMLDEPGWMLQEMDEFLAR
jgi:pimeloyl-ACP methyl ester carboxylesterase